MTNDATTPPTESQPDDDETLRIPVDTKSKELALLASLGTTLAGPGSTGSKETALLVSLALAPVDVTGSSVDDAVSSTACRGRSGSSNPFPTSRVHSGRLIQYCESNEHPVVKYPAEWPSHAQAVEKGSTYLQKKASHMFVDVCRYRKG